MLKKIYLFPIFLLLFSCGSYNKDLGTTLDYKYYSALGYLSNGNLEKSKKLFEQIVDEYPYKDEAQEAQVFLIWIYYLTDDLISAEVNIDSFLKYYVSNQYTSWIKYMKALVEYEQISISLRDQSYAKNALYSFADIYKNQKNSQYAKDARYRLEVIKYNLAERTLLIGKQYEKNTNYIAAISRYQELVDLYKDTPFVEEAMYRLVANWLRLGGNDEAFRIASVLGYNAPDSLWYAKSLDLIDTFGDFDEGFKLKKKQ